MLGGSGIFDRFLALVAHAARRTGRERILNLDLVPQRRMSWTTRPFSLLACMPLAVASPLFLIVATYVRALLLYLAYSY